MTQDHHSAPDDRDEVAMLIRLAGRRPVVPEERRERVEAAVRQRWASEVARRRRIRTLWIVAAAASVALALVLVPYAVRREGHVPTTTGPVLEVEVSVGSPSIEPPRDARRSLDAGVPVGAAITTDPRSRVALRHEAGASVRIDVASRVRVVSAMVLALERGAVYVDSGTDTGSAPIVVRTPLGDVEHAGTQFEIRLVDGSVRVRVREGTVLIKGRGRERRVSAGSEFVADPDGGSTLTDVAPDAPAWKWLTEVVPTPEIEGRTARSFLEWAAREGGWTLRFAREDVERSAASTKLSGSIRNLTLDQALEAVLPTCRMTHRIEDGSIVVDSAQR